MARAINGIPSLNLQATPATSSGQVYGTPDSDPNSFQLLVNWFLNQNINSLSQIGSNSDGTSSNESSSSPFDSMFMSSSFGSSSALSGGDPFSALGKSAMQGLSPTMLSQSPFGNLSTMVQDPITDLKRLQAFNDYSNLINADDPTAASYFDPQTGNNFTGIIEEVIVDTQGSVSFLINGSVIPLAYVKSLTRSSEEAAAV